MSKLSIEKVLSGSPIAPIKKQKIVKDPKLTVNKLGEYVEAGGRRRNTILKTIKYPDENVFASSSYKDARQAIKSYFINNFDDDILLNFISKMQAKTAGSQHDTKMIKSEIEAAKKVLSSTSINKKYTYRSYEGPNIKLNINGVEISVLPDLVAIETRGGKTIHGGVKLHLSKSSSNNVDVNENIATILHHYSSTDIDFSKHDVKPKMCISYDVHKDTFIECPKAVKSRFADISAECSTIAAVWPTI